jgi:hypothetical protein
VGHVARMAEATKAYTILIRKPQEKRLVGRPKQGRENKIETRFKMRTPLTFFFMIDFDGNLLFNAIMNVRNP